ncbi:MAG: hypothetical protein QM488_07310 [Rhizobiaceae bacterium]
MIGITAHSKPLNLDPAKKTKAKGSIEVSLANVTKAEAAVAKTRDRLNDAEELQKRNVGRANTVTNLRFTLQGAESALL